MKKKIIALLMGTLAAGMALTGCSKKTETVEMEMLLSDDTLEGGAMAKMVEKFNQEFADEGISIKLNEVAYADLMTQLQNRATVNELPALVKTTSFGAVQDYILPLDESNLNPDDFLLDGVRDGSFYATTINTTAVGLIINKTAFDEAGVSYPLTEEERWTWDEFIEAVAEVTERSEAIQTGLVIDHSQQRINTVLYQHGMRLYDEADPNKIVFRSEETKKGIERLLTMYAGGGVSKASVGVGTENAQDVFKTGTVAAHLAGNWVLSDYSTNITDFEWCPVLMPYDTETQTCLGGNWMYAMSGSGYEEEAVKFLEWFYEPENYTEYCTYGNYLPGISGNITPDYTVEGLEIFNMEIAAGSDVYKYSESVGASHKDVSWGNAVRDGIDKAIAGELDADGVMEYVVEQILSNYEGTYE